jgi:hypothetical protein
MYILGFRFFDSKQDDFELNDSKYFPNLICFK